MNLDQVIASLHAEILALTLLVSSLTQEVDELVAHNQELLKQMDWSE